MIGPPGSGNTMLAKRIPTILSPLTFEEALETTKIHSVAGILDSGTGLVGVRPYRAPHHAISDAGLIGGGAAASSERIRDRVVNAREIQLNRFAQAKERIYSNAQMSSRQIRAYYDLSTDCERLLERAITQQGLSARAHDRILKVSRTIADLESAPHIEEKHIAEAIISHARSNLLGMTSQAPQRRPTALG